MSFITALDDVLVERDRQDETWGTVDHVDGVGSSDQIARAIDTREHTKSAPFVTWANILDEECAEVLAARDINELRTELIQTAAVCFAWVEAIDRRVDVAAGCAQADAELAAGLTKPLGEVLAEIEAEEATT